MHMKFALTRVLAWRVNDEWHLRWGRKASQVAAITRALAGVLLRPRMQGAAWYGAAEAAIATIYQLHPAPGQLCAAVVQGLADAAIGAPSRPFA